MSGPGGAVSVTADSVIGASGKPVRVWAVNMLSGGTAGQLVLRNGAAAGADIWVREVGTANTGKTVDYGETGVFFPAGCFYDDDSNFTHVVIQYSQEA